MPPKCANLKPREVIRALQKGGFFIHEQSGSHVHLKHPAKPGRVTVPYHERFDLPKHIIKSIVRQAGLTNAEFFELLDSIASIAQFFNPGSPDTGPTYASSRPAVIAPIQHVSVSQAKPLAVPETGALSSCGSPNTFFRMIFRTIIPPKTNTIFTPKSGFVPLVVASPIS